MPILLWIAWLGAGAVAGAAVWWLAQRFAPDSASPLSQPNRVLFAGLLLLGAALGGVLAWRRVPLSGGAGILVVTALLGAISLIDLRTRRIPDMLNLVLLAWALVQMTWQRQPTIIAAGLGLLVSGGLFLLLALIRPGAMGLGDVKLAAVLGALLGFPLTLIALVVGIFAGGAVALCLVLSQRGKSKSTMAYGPYLALGGWVAALGAVLGLWG